MLIANDSAALCTCKRQSILLQLQITADVARHIMKMSPCNNIIVKTQLSSGTPRLGFMVYGLGLRLLGFGVGFYVFAKLAVHLVRG